MHSSLARARASGVCSAAARSRFVAHEAEAGLGAAAALVDVLLDLLREEVDGVDQRGQRELAVEAIRVAQRLGQQPQLADVRLATAAALDATDDFCSALGAAVAGRAAAAALVLDEPLELGAEVEHAGRVVEEDEAAAAEADGALFAERLSFDCQVEREGRDDAEQRAAGLQRLERVALGRPAGANLVGVTHRRAEGQLEGADAVDVAGEREDHRARVALRADLGPLFDAVAHDPGGAVVAGDVVDVATLPEDAGLGRERRPQLRHAAPVFDRGDQADSSPQT